jgi:mRNA-degrading endonuclease RelE of RelBE toxin-antitoxin system
LKKIYYFSSLKDPRSTAKPMQERLIWKRRRRIWAYRVIFDIDDAWRIIIVLIVGHRRDVYR